MQVKTLQSGEIDYEHFWELITANRARPAIVNVNCGTTVKGAVDDLDRVLAILQECGYSEDRFYIHVDGALFGMMVSTPSIPEFGCGSEASEFSFLLGGTHLRRSLHSTMAWIRMA